MGVLHHFGRDHNCCRNRFLLNHNLDKYQVSRSLSHSFREVSDWDFRSLYRLRILQKMFWNFWCAARLLMKYYDDLSDPCASVRNSRGCL